MVQKALQKLHPGDGFRFGFIALFTVAPSKGHVGIGYLEDPGIGNGHPVGITSKVFDHTCRRSERLFGIYHPRLLNQVARYIFFDLALLFQYPEFAGKAGAKHTG